MTDDAKITATLLPMHPGEMLREDSIEPLGLLPARSQKACGVPRTRIERTVAERLGDTAVRLGRFFGTSPEFWMNLQARSPAVFKPSGGTAAKVTLPVELLH